MARWLNAIAHRRAFGLLGASALGGIVGLSQRQDAEGKKRRKKKKCGPCRSKKKGKCKKRKPDGTACGDGGTCQGGACVVPTCNPECTPPATCVDGACVCPEDNVCAEPGTCCPEEVSCDAEGGCVCGSPLDGPACSCPTGSTFCATSVFAAQCCLTGDTCSESLGCITETCSAGNAFCSLGWATCDGNPDCTCFARFEDGISVCVNTFTVNYCNPATSCTGDTDCPNENMACVDVSCCPGAPSMGACIPRCEAP